MKKGTFTSVWDGIEITTPAELDLETGEINILETVNADGLEILDEEFFTDEDGKNYNVCPECHEFITKTFMVEGTGKTLHEITGCSNPDCENYYEEF